MAEKTLLMDTYSGSQESAKLRFKRLRSFRIIELITKNAVNLELRDLLMIHPVVHVINTSPHFDIIILIPIGYILYWIYPRLCQFDRRLFRQI
jgi:hypothetical protein